VPFFLALKAEALHRADRTFEALEAIEEAEGLVERFEERLWRADLHRLRGVFLATMGADETQIDASFRQAIRIAREQKSIMLVPDEYPIVPKPLLNSLSASRADRQGIT
jgi:hypothetical protein